MHGILMAVIVIILIGIFWRIFLGMAIFAAVMIAVAVCGVMAYHEPKTAFGILFVGGLIWTAINAD
jgi:hypothetical protein